MELPRAIVGFAPNDVEFYQLMQTWREAENIPFNFDSARLDIDVHQNDDNHVRAVCREKLEKNGKYILLIGKHTRGKYKYLKWETETAMEKRCTVVCVNLDGTRRMDSRTCPSMLRDVGAVFVPPSPKVIAYALRHYKMDFSGHFHYPDMLCEELEIGA